MMESKSILHGKTIVAIGDSLFFGNKLGNNATWLNKLAAKHEMTIFNHGINGNPVAMPESEPNRVPMCIRYADMEDGADYVVIMGGANDKRLHIPIGEDNSTDINTFKGALNVMLSGLITKYPKARLLCMTNYNRWPTKNKLGLSDIDYVIAMEEIARKYAIPCFNNYYNSGISFQNPAQLTWIDEGLSLGGGENHHFSDEAYTWLMNKYEKLLESL